MVCDIFEGRAPGDVVRVRAARAVQHLVYSHGLSSMPGLSFAACSILHVSLRRTLWVWTPFFTPFFVKDAPVRVEPPGILCCVTTAIAGAYLISAGSPSSSSLGPIVAIAGVTAAMTGAYPNSASISSISSGLVSPPAPRPAARPPQAGPGAQRCLAPPRRGQGSPGENTPI